MTKEIWKKEYDGFESLSDLGRDVHEAFDERFNAAAKELPGEFQGTLTVTMTYSPPETTETQSERFDLAAKADISVGALHSLRYELAKLHTIEAAARAIHAEGLTRAGVMRVDGFGEKPFSSVSCDALNALTEALDSIGPAVPLPIGPGRGPSTRLGTEGAQGQHEQRTSKASRTCTVCGVPAFGGGRCSDCESRHTEGETSKTTPCKGECARVVGGSLCYPCQRFEEGFTRGQSLDRQGQELFAKFEARGTEGAQDFAFANSQAAVEANKQDAKAAATIEKAQPKYHVEPTASKVPGNDRPWPPHDFVKKLADAAQCLLSGNGISNTLEYEGIEAAITAARSWLEDFGDCTTTERHSAYEAFWKICEMVEHDSPVYLIAVEELSALGHEKRLRLDLVRKEQEP